MIKWSISVLKGETMKYIEKHPMSMIVVGIMRAS